MESFMNFKNFGDTAQTNGNGGNQTVSYPLGRQSSVCSLTFEEFQNTLGGASRDFGSMNMEEFLKSIWSAEEGNQTMASSVGGERGVANGNLQRQGSLTLPRTLSQKTVDEVWRDVLKETVGPKDGNATGVLNLGQKEPTLNEITLEEFLFRAGVVREDVQPPAGPNTTGIYNIPQASAVGFQQTSQNQGLFGNQLAEHKNMVPNSPNLGINMGGVMPISTQQLPQAQLQPLFPKQTTVTFSTMNALNNGNNAPISSPRTKGPMIGLTSTLNNTIQGRAMVMPRLGNGAVGSPVNRLTQEAIAKSGSDTGSLSPSPYNFGEGGGRGRRSGTSLEKVVERRRKRMIKNRESAARSRARKQAYTLELEAEVAKLKELNQELRKKQEESMKMQESQILEMMKKPQGGERSRLRRTVTGPW